MCHIDHSGLGCLLSLGPLILVYSSTTDFWCLGSPDPFIPARLFIECAPVAECGLSRRGSRLLLHILTAARCLIPSTTDLHSRIVEIRSLEYLTASLTHTITLWFPFSFLKKDTPLAYGQFFASLSFIPCALNMFIL